MRSIRQITILREDDRRPVTAVTMLDARVSTQTISAPKRPNGRRLKIGDAVESPAANETVKKVLSTIFNAHR